MKERGREGVREGRREGGRERGREGRWLYKYVAGGAGSMWR